MKRQVLKIFSMLILAVALAAVAAHANPASGLKANIPFDFSVGGNTLPAGVYTVTPMSTSSVLLIRREDCRAGAMVRTDGMYAEQIQDQTKLVFHRYGNQYFLAQVWTAGESNGREFPKSRAERELVKDRSKYLAKNTGEP
jgi:hypothetical protein